MALSGPLAATSDPRVAARTARLAQSSDGADRDALIEALGHIGGRVGGEPLTKLIDDGVDGPTRAKIAEAFATHPDALPTLRRLAEDPDPQVRANAVWAIGAVAPPNDMALLTERLSDPDASVAGNAAAALGRLGLRGARVSGPLCAALGNGFPYVRANSLASLGMLRTRCDADVVRTLLASDPSEIVRMAAARLITRAPAPDREKDRTALAHCADDDPSGDVAAACVGAPEPAPARTTEVSVYIVPTGASGPTPLSPFALVRSDGLTRLGIADRAGSVYEHDAPRGPLRLGIPAPLLF